MKLFKSVEKVKFQVISKSFHLLNNSIIWSVPITTFLIFQFITRMLSFVLKCLLKRWDDRNSFFISFLYLTKKNSPFYVTLHCISTSSHKSRVMREWVALHLLAQTHKFKKNKRGGFENSLRRFCRLAMIIIQILCCILMSSFYFS